MIFDPIQLNDERKQELQEVAYSLSMAFKNLLGQPYIPVPFIRQIPIDRESKLVEPVKLSGEVGFAGERQRPISLIIGLASYHIPLISNLGFFRAEKIGYVARAITPETTEEFIIGEQNKVLLFSLQWFFREAVYYYFGKTNPEFAKSKKINEDADTLRLLWDSFETICITGNADPKNND